MEENEVEFMEQGESSLGNVALPSDSLCFALALPLGGIVVPLYACWIEDQAGMVGWQWEVNF